MTDFSSLALCEPLLRALSGLGFTAATPIQAQAIPPLLEGRDVLGLAQTGTGKTAAFGLPLLHRLTGETPARPKFPHALILTPTRELAVQVDSSLAGFARHLRVRRTVAVGGVDIGRQERALARGVDILTATPGRLMDLMKRGAVNLSCVSTLVLDEADRMLDMGFLPAVKTITAALSHKRQTVLFSATLPDAVAGLAGSMMKEPVRVEVAPQSTVSAQIDDRILFVAQADKRDLLLDLLTTEADGQSRAIIFSRTKHGANRIGLFLEKAGVESDVIHGNKSQGARQRALNAFRDGRVRALVATDIAARGIDVDGITHVINYDLPVEPEAYVHRIGRTGRAGASGIALSFCDHGELAHLKAIEKTIQRRVVVHEDHAFHSDSVARSAEGPAPRGGAAKPKRRSSGDSRPQGSARGGPRDGNAAAASVAAAGGAPFEGDSRPAKAPRRPRRPDAPRGDGARSEGYRPEGHRVDSHHGEGRRSEGQRADIQRADHRRSEGHRNDGARADKAAAGPRSEGPRNGPRNEGPRKARTGGKGAGAAGASGPGTNPGGRQGTRRRPDGEARRRAS